MPRVYGLLSDHGVALRSADALIGAIADEVAALGELGEKTTIIVTPDHGRNSDFRDHADIASTIRHAHRRARRLAPPPTTARFDFRAWKGLRIGPVISTSIGQSTQIEINGKNTSDFKTAVHGWVMFAPRGAYDLQLEKSGETR